MSHSCVAAEMLFMKSSVSPHTKIQLWSLATALLIGLSACFANRSQAAVAVLTHHNDLNRSGANLSETLLATNNVNTNQFGKIFTRTVDDEIHTQPLIVTNVNVPGKGSYNLVIVATVSNSVYAFDADNAANSAPLWKTNFLSPGIVPPRNTDMTFACGGNYKDFAGNMGIVGTPVIDPDTSTLYVVSRTKEPGPTYVQRLWALDVQTGTEASAPNGHLTIAFVNGTAFDGQVQNQRAALALVNGYVYITWSSHCDGGAYHGFIAAYNTTNLALPPLTYNVTPGGNQAGIWMSDQAPPADAAGNIYLTTGNGSFNGTTTFGESFLKLTNTGAALSRVDWFTPYDWNTNLNSKDLDLGSGGVLLIPGTSLLFTGGKAGRLYLVNATNMGHLVNAAATSDTNIVQSWDLGSHQVHGGPVWWDGSTTSYAYIWAASSDRLRQYTFSRALGKFSSTTPTAQSATIGGSGQPGGLLSLSANGTNAGAGIIWASVNTSASANQATVAGTLHAYDAQNVARELWHSDMIPSRDAVGNFAKFVAPTVANGKVYLATFSNRLNVYGLLPPLPLTILQSGANLVFTWPTNNGGGFVLQAKATLDGPAWTNVGSAVTISNGVYTTVVPASNTATFYRLKR
jgi:hypothetical protein